MTWTTPVPTLPSPPPKNSRYRSWPIGVAEHRKMTFRRSPLYLHVPGSGVLPWLPGRLRWGQIPIYSRPKQNKQEMDPQDMGMEGLWHGTNTG